MRNNCVETELEEVIRASVEMTDAPTPELNNKLKAALYRQGESRSAETACRTYPVTLVFAYDIKSGNFFFAGCFCPYSNRERLPVLLCRRHLPLYLRGGRIDYHSGYKENKHERGYHNPY